MTLPSITVALPTFGRAGHPSRCLDEALECFLRQDYAGPKELVVLSDDPRQELFFTHPEVKVINLPFRCSCLAKKRNRAVRAGTGNLVTSWDDDDVRLSHSLSTLVEALGSHSFAHVRGHWYSEGNRIVKFCPHAHAHNWICTRELFESVGGYGSVAMADDDQQFTRRIGAAYRQVDARPFLIYRWATPGISHISGYPSRHTGDSTGWDAIGRLPVVSGKHFLNPVWLRDYEADAAAFGSA